VPPIREVVTPGYMPAILALLSAHPAGMDDMGDWYSTRCKPEHPNAASRGKRPQLAVATGAAMQVRRTG
jgi:hypothetical protein